MLSGLLKKCLVVWLVLLASRAADGGTAFWVWNRSTPLSHSEKAELAGAKVTALYWHFAEIENRGDGWQWKKLPRPLPEKSTAALRIVPVIRLESSAPQPFEDATLTAKIADAFRSTGADEWQLDYDAPDRLIPAYAAFLTTLRPLAPKLTATALAGWARLPAFPALCASVAELEPMFYDLEPDTADDLKPLIDPGAEALVEAWRKNCPIPWRAGLPWFSRLTLYGTDGKSRGHLRQWAWDDVIFRRELRWISEGVFRAGKPFAVGLTNIAEGETLVVRGPDFAALTSLAKLAGRDAIYFRLPDGAASSGGSLREFAATVGAPELTLEINGGRLVLTNSGNRDLPPRATGDGPQDRGYALEVDAAGPVFREAEAGEFFRVAAHRNPDAEEPERVAIPAATQLTFWFSALPAGEALESGIFQLAPAADAKSVRYRVLYSVENPPWKPLAPSR